jgi:hypothetical protein
LVASKWNRCQAAPLAWKKSAMRLLPPHGDPKHHNPGPVGWLLSSRNGLFSRSMLVGGMVL